MDPLIESIKNSTVFVVKRIESGFLSLKNHIFDVRIKNGVLPVKGSVTVKNQLDIRPEIQNASNEIKKAISELKEFYVIVKNQKEFPKSIEVSNFTNKVRLLNIGVIIDALNDLNKTIKSIEVSPNVNVKVPKQEPPVINIPKNPKPIVNVETEKVDLTPIYDLLKFWQSMSKDAKHAISVRLTNGKKFYEAVNKIGDIVAGTSGSQFVDSGGYTANAIVNKNNELQVTTSDTWGINHIDQTDPNITYYGEENVDGNWRIRKIDENTSVSQITYATKQNNPTYSDYNSAFNNRLSLNYDTYSNVF